MTENGLRRMNTDFWGGTPFESVGKTPTAPDAPKARGKSLSQSLPLSSLTQKIPALLLPIRSGIR
ncbi:MAG: hypothetical protein IIW17_06955, partial [Clostridia bacterium]|nr:hypothetical protein [Clostridia bacterium]